MIAILPRETTPVLTGFEAKFSQAYRHSVSKPAAKIPLCESTSQTRNTESRMVDVCFHIPETQRAICSKPFDDLDDLAGHLFIAWCNALANDDTTRPLFESNVIIVPDLSSVRLVIQTVGGVESKKGDALAGSVPKNSEQKDWSCWFKKLDAFKESALNWDGGKAGPPNETSFQNVEAFLNCLQQRSYLPRQIATSVVGGIGVTFRNLTKKVYVEFTNKGGVNILFSDGQTKPIVEKLQPNDDEYLSFIDKAKAYLHE